MPVTAGQGAGAPAVGADVHVLVASSPAPVWGAQLYLLDQVEPLRQRGIVLTLASPADSPFAKEWLARGWPLVDLPLRLHGGLRRGDGSDRRPGPVALVLDAVAMVPSAVRLARTGRQFDLLHSYALRSHLEVAVAGHLARRPSVLDQVNIVRPGIGRRVLRGIARLASLTVANSAATAAVVGDRAAVWVIQPGIDLHRFAPGAPEPGLREQLTSDPSAPLVAIIGRLDVRKGIQILLEAMARLQGPAAAAHLVVVGDAGTGPPEFAAELRRTGEALLGERVRFVGRRSDIPQILRSVDVMVNASKAEPFGLTVLEAQACGTAVIGTDAGGIPEFVEHGVTGLLVPPFEVEPMAAALERVLGDAALVEAMTAEALRRAHPARGVEAQYDELASMYRSVAAGTRAPTQRPSSR